MAGKIRILQTFKKDVWHILQNQAKGINVMQSKYSLAIITFLHRYLFGVILHPLVDFAMSFSTNVMYVPFSLTFLK